ncbi:MAG: MJ0042-type zinc finger domain-containing protein [Gemmataceae bacterium]
MPAVVRCPSCSGPLRVGDDLTGRKVRCPACSTVFDAPAPAAEGPPLDLDVVADPPPAVETVPVDPWKVMNLSLDVPDEKPPAPEGRPLGAVEIGRQEADVPTAPRRDDPPARRARLSDDHDDMRTCPACRKLIYRDARRCSWCGERYDEDGPRREPTYDAGGYRRRARRDTDPHRGGTVLLLGVLSLVTPFFVCPTLGLATLAGTVLGLIAWVMGAADLAKMRAGAMDPDGEGNTRGGYVCGVIGVFFNLFVLLSCGAFIGYAAYEGERNKQQRRGGFGNPPPIVVRPQEKR